MPKRGLIAIVTTAFALVLLFSFKTPSDQGLAVRGGGSVVALGGAPLATTAPVVPQSTPNAGDANAAAGAPANAAVTPKPATGATASGQVTGPTVDTQFGPVQVQVTMSKGKIVDIQAIQLPTDRRRSQMIGQYAAPILRTEALQAQSAQIDIVTGATYTSMGYAQSLQGALDQVHS
jgi:uncharacterized protein with FMN-binding domain